MQFSFKTRRTLLAVTLSALCSPIVIAAETGEEVLIVTATRVSQKDSSAPFATEIHTRKEIMQSGSTSLYDFLAQHTSIQIVPSYGNKHAPKIDMRGFGIGDGYQNIVVSIDGVRINNIDMVSPLIGAISLADIERIEITKGSGSVLFGDGATAGTIQIKTRQAKGGKIEVTAGNYGSFNSSASAGLRQENYTLSASASRNNNDGFSAMDATGHKDASRNDTWRLSGSMTPTDTVQLKLSAGGSQIDTRYVGSLSLQKLNDDPGQSNGKTYTQQRFESDFWKGGADLWLFPSLKVSVEHHKENKHSDYRSPGYNTNADYDYRNDDLSLQYLREDTVVTLGVQNFVGHRNGVSDTTSKENTGFFVQGQQSYDALKLSAGARRETVDYTYRPNAGAKLNDDHTLNAWDIGLNYRIDAQYSLFSNLNSAYQSPDIDRFFNPLYNASFDVVGVTFNTFIKPTRSKTLNIGLNSDTTSHRFKLTLFHTWLKDEIYLSPSFINTNIDKSHKYGLELQDFWQLSSQLKGMLNYAYTRARIDSENENGGAFNGKDLPGVAKHSLNLGLDYRVSDKANIGITHAWRSSSYAADDFDNNNAQRQRAYSSTDVSYRRQMNKDVEIFANVDNIFAKTNGIWVQDDAIYPTNFARTWRVGSRVSF